MTQPNEEQLPEDLSKVAEELRTRRTDATPLELDQIKRRAMAQASMSRRGTGSLRSRVLAIALLTGLIASGGTGAVIAAGGGGSSGPESAAKSQYKPGKGCGKPVKTGPPGNPNNPPSSCPP
jgi:hypothetical protein